METMTPHPALLTVEESADALRIGMSTLKKLVRQGEIPVVRIGRSVRLRPGDISAWIERQAGQGRAA